jgi:hypothetical protein
METLNKPFSIGFVLRTTAKHIRKSIEISITKTFERLAEFADDREKSEEIFMTLSLLHQLRRQLDDFQTLHSKIFKGN